MLPLPYIYGYSIKMVQPNATLNSIVLLQGFNGYRDWVCHIDDLNKYCGRSCCQDTNPDYRPYGYIDLNLYPMKRINEREESIEIVPCKEYIIMTRENKATLAMSAYNNGKDISYFCYPKTYMYLPKYTDDYIEKIFNIQKKKYKLQKDFI